MCVMQLRIRLFNVMPGLLGITLLVVAFGCNQESSPVPAEVTIGTHLDNLVLTRSLVLDDPAIGRISDIRTGDFANAPGATLVVAGLAGAVIADSSFRIISAAPFPDAGEEITRVIVDVESDRVVEFLSIDQRNDEVSLHNELGDLIWSFSDDKLSLSAGRVDFAALDDTGNLSFAVSGPDYAWLLGSDGQPVTEFVLDQAFLQTQIALIDGDADGDRDIVIYARMPFQWQRLLFDRTGEPLGSDNCACDMLEYTTRFPTMTGPPHFLVVNEGLTEQPDSLAEGVYDFLGQPIVSVQVDPPPNNGCFEDYPRAQRIQFTPNGLVYTAISWYFCWDSDPTDAVGQILSRTQLTIHDPGGTIVYHEVLETSLGGLVAIPRDDGGEDLLVGTDGKVYLYQLAVE